MVRKHRIMIALILLSLWLLPISDTIGFTESKKTVHKHKKQQSHVQINKKKSSRVKKGKKQNLNIHSKSKKQKLNNKKRNSSTKKIKQKKNYSKADVSHVPQKLILSSASVLVKDQQTGQLLVQKQDQAILPIASISKLMTAMVVLDSHLNLQEYITIDHQDVDLVRHSRSRLPVGTSLTRREAMLLALMSSENRAAHALARTYPGGKQSFVNAMNYKARYLGLTGTRFQDPTGISSGNVSTAQDLARMIDAAYQYDLIREFTTCKETKINSGRCELAFRNTNRLVRSANWQIGLSKTGFIDEAGRCLVMQVNVARRSLLIVLLDSQSSAARFEDANRIKRWIEQRMPAEAQVAVDKKPYVSEPLNDAIPL